MTVASRGRICSLLQEPQRFEHIVPFLLGHRFEKLGEPLRSRFEDSLGNIAALIGEEHETNTAVGVRVCGPLGP